MKQSKPSKDELRENLLNNQDPYTKEFLIILDKIDKFCITPYDKNLAYLELKERIYNKKQKEVCVAAFDY